jgi:hypothetical protein
MERLGFAETAASVEDGLQVPKICNICSKKPSENTILCRTGGTYSSFYAGIEGESGISGLRQLRETSAIHTLEAGRVPRSVVYHVDGL